MPARGVAALALLYDLAYFYYSLLRSRWRLCRLTDAACPLRVHTVFLRFSNLGLAKNLSPNLLAELCGVA